MEGKQNFKVETLVGTEIETRRALKYETPHVAAAEDEITKQKIIEDSRDTIITQLTKGLSCLGTS